MTSGIYQIQNTVNGKVYIGSTRDLQARRREHYCHLRHGRHPNSHLQNAWSKYGEANFAYKVMEVCDLEMMLLREKDLIDLYESCDRTKGYNIESDPVDRRKSEDHKRKISETLKRKYQEGYIHPNLGRKVPKSIVEKMAKKLKGRKQSKATVAKRAKSQSKKVAQYDANGHLVKVHPSLKQAAIELQCSSGNVTRCCKSETRTIRGYKFKYWKK